MAKSEEYSMNELRVIARMWNVSMYEAARWDIQDYYEGYPDIQLRAERMSDDEAIKEYLRIKSNY